MAGDVIAWIYDANHHCERCTEERFGEGFADLESVVDSEGNEISAIMDWETTLDQDHDWSTGPNVTGCGTCGDIVEYQISDEGKWRERSCFYTIAQLREQWWETRYDDLKDALLEQQDESLSLAEDLARAKNIALKALEAIKDIERQMRDLPEVLDIVRDLADELED